MKALILAGGAGTRLSEETRTKPKPMVGIGDQPILWHIMKIYSHYGFNDFLILLGYKGYLIKEFFSNHFLHQSDVTIDLRSDSREVHSAQAEPWRVTLQDTGSDTMTGGRVLRARKYVGDEPFLLTYGDGLGDVAIDQLVKFHRAHGKLCTVTAVRPSARFGALGLDQDDYVREFREKPDTDGGWINGGFFVCEPGVFDYIEGDSTSFEREPLERLAGDGQLVAFKHRGFWRPMDTLRDKVELERLWTSGTAQWRVWQ